MGAVGVGGVEGGLKGRRRCQPGAAGQGRRRCPCCAALHLPCAVVSLPPTLRPRALWRAGEGVSTSSGAYVSMVESVDEGCLEGDLSCMRATIQGYSTNDVQARLWVDAQAQHACWGRCLGAPAGAASPCALA